VQRLERGDDAERGKARDVFGAHRFDVLEAMAAAARGRRAGGRGAFDGVERHTDGAIADGVDLDLPAAAVEHRHHAVEFRSGV
jgi:hypothetical protein